MTAGQFPQAFIKREQTQLGPQWDAFEKAHHLPPPVSIRFNPYKAKQPYPGSPIPWTHDGIYLDQRPSFTLDPAFHGGKYYVQEASSMFLEQAFRPLAPGKNSLKVLDLCAAPGGKSTHLLSIMNENSLLVSNEVIQSRAGILSENIKKWGHCNVVVTNNDPKDFQRLEGFFDVIIVDAPCSGEGLFRKEPGALEEWSEDVVALCSKRQRRILNDVWPALKTGGTLIYSTCTYNAEENEENLKWLRQEYAVESLPLEIDPEWKIHAVETGGVVGYRFFPHRVKGEGFFLSAVRKLDDTPEKEFYSRDKFLSPPGNVTGDLHDWILNPDGKSFFFHNDRIQFFPKNRVPDLQAIQKNMRVLLAGTPMVTLKHNKMIPDHSFALSLEMNRDSFKVISLDIDSALQYLRKDVLTFPSQEKGFALVTFENVGLGWVNVLDNRTNNMYPSEWRIRIR